MLTDEDIKKLIEAEKEVFPTKADFDDLRKDFSTLQTSVESFATGTKTNDAEIKVANHRINGHEDWIKQAAPKVGVEFKP